MTAVKLVHFSDLLCIWGYVGEANLFQLTESFGDKVHPEIHFCSVFPDPQTKLTKAWANRGGFQGYADHVQEVAAKFDGISVHPDTWARVQPRSSASPQLLIKAIQLLEADSPAPRFADRPSVRAAHALRVAFFTRAQDISNWAVQRAICDSIGVDFDAALKHVETGDAIASLAADYELAQALGVQGSPTYILNEGRQKLFGNITYKILAANVTELLTDDPDENASACR